MLAQCASKKNNWSAVHTEIQESKYFFRHFLWQFETNLYAPTLWWIAPFELDLVLEEIGKCALWCFLIYYQLPSETKRAHMASKLHAIVMPRICSDECGGLCLIFKLSFFQMTGYHQRKYCVIFCMNPKTIQLFSEWVGILNSHPPFCTLWYDDRLMEGWIQFKLDLIPDNIQGWGGNYSNCYDVEDYEKNCKAVKGKNEKSALELSTVGQGSWRGNLKSLWKTWKESHN